MAKLKYNQEYVDSFLKVLGCKLLTPYKDVKSKFSFLCHCGEIGESTFDSFKNAGTKGCTKCSGKRANAHNTLTFEFVKSYFEEQGCILLEDTYVNSKTKMRYICVCGRESLIDWNKFKLGRRCRRCAREKVSEQQRFTIKEVRRFLESVGFTLLEKDYVNMHTSMRIKCTCGKIVNKSFSVIKACPKCTCKNNSKPKKKQIKKSYTISDLVYYFWELTIELGRYPTLSDFNKTKGYPSGSSYQRKFGTFDNFLNELNLLGSDGWYKYDEQLIIDYYPMYEIEYIKRRLMVKRSTGTIKNKAISMGVNVLSEYRYGSRKYSKDEVIDSLLEFIETNKYIPTLKEIHENPEMPNIGHFKKFFISYSKCLEQLGLKEEAIQITSQMEKDICSDYLKGVTYKHIGIKYEITYEKVKSILLKNKVDLKVVNSWTDEQIEKLRLHYPFNSWENLLDILYPFNKSAILTKASQLNIKRECFGFSEEDEKYLKMNYGRIKVSEIASHLGKTEASVSSKANRMGLISREKWTDEELTLLKKIYPYYTNNELMSYFPNRSVTSISSMATMILGLSKDKEALKEKYSTEIKEQLISELKSFSEEIGRTPTTDDINNNSKLGSSTQYNRYFGSYTEACKQAGLPVNSMMFGKSYNIEAKNGEPCLSYKEKVITDLLIDNNISYKKEVLYSEFIKEYNESYIRCDWVIGDVMIEYFGMMDKPFYKERALDKISICQKYNVKLIDLYPEDLLNDFSGLLNKFSKMGIKLTIMRDIA